MLRTDSLRVNSGSKVNSDASVSSRTNSNASLRSHASLPRVGAGTRSTRSGASTTRRTRSAHGDAVEILEKRFGYFPQSFQWRGHAHHVQAVESTRTKMGRVAQLCFRVRCQEGVFELTQNAQTNIWSLSVVQLNS